MDIYLIYACGGEFLLSGASIKLEVVQYVGSETRADVEQRFQVVYNGPFNLTGEAAQGYQKRKVATFNLQPGGQQGSAAFLALKLTIEANIDNATGEVPMMRDFFLEGFSLNTASNAAVRVAPKQCVIF